MHLGSSLETIPGVWVCKSQMTKIPTGQVLGSGATGLRLQQMSQGRPSAGAPLTVISGQRSSSPRLRCPTAGPEWVAMPTNSILTKERALLPVFTQLLEQVIHAAATPGELWWPDMAGELNLHILGGQDSSGSIECRFETKACYVFNSIPYVGHIYGCLHIGALNLLSLPR